MRNDNDSFDCVIESIRARRVEQDAKWGGESHDDTHYFGDWINFIGRFAKIAYRAGLSGQVEKYEDALIDIAALAVAAIQSHRRVSFRGRQ